MVNNLELGERLKIIMDYYQLSASSFADKIKVQRSSISHLLSGRNRPSLDFVMKVVKEFDEVELYWLLNGKGSFPKKASPISNKTSTDHKISPKKGNKLPEFVEHTTDNDDKVVERIVLFYKDGTFKEYKK